MFQVIKDLNEYKEFMKSTYDDFGCQEEWKDNFGISLKWNEETGEVLETLDEYKGEIKVCPEEFPCVVHYMSEVAEDYRTGDLVIRQLDWISLREINSSLK